MKRYISNESLARNSNREQSKTRFKGEQVQHTKSRQFFLLWLSAGLLKCANARHSGDCWGGCGFRIKRNTDLRNGAAPSMAIIRVRRRERHRRRSGLLPLSLSLSFPISLRLRFSFLCLFSSLSLSRSCTPSDGDPPMLNDILEKPCSPSIGLALFECDCPAPMFTFTFMFMFSPPIDTGRLLGCATAKKAVDVGENAVSAVRLDEGRCGCWCCCSWLV